MFNYTPEGVQNLQMTYALDQGDEMNKFLKGINRSLKILSLLAIAKFVITYKDDIKKLKNLKGE